MGLTRKPATIFVHVYRHCQTLETKLQLRPQKSVSKDRGSCQIKYVAVLYRPWQFALCLMFKSPCTESRSMLII